MSFSFSFFSVHSLSPPLCRLGQCKLSVMGRVCEVGLQRRHYYILSGSVTSIIGTYKLIMYFSIPSLHDSILIPSSCVNDLKQTLTRIAKQAAGL